jgi:membrane protease subunit HflK
MLRRGGDRFKGMVPGGLGSPRGIVLIGLAAVLIWLMTGWYRVDPAERGVELVFGKMRAVTLPGLHWNWPAPIGGILKPNVDAERFVDVGFVTAGRGAREGEKRAVERESLMLTGDENIIDIQATVFWKIDLRPRKTVVEGKEREVNGVRDFLFSIRFPERSVKDASESALREIAGRRDFESIRTVGRAEIEQEAIKIIQRLLDDYSAGVQIIRVQLQPINPPAKALDAFRDVQAARADKERAINDAHGYANRVVAQAEGEFERIVRASEAYRQERIANAEGEASRFTALYKEYAQEKDITRQRIYLDTMRDIMRSMDKVLLDKNQGAGVLPYLPLDPLRPSPARPQPPSAPSVAPVQPPQTSDSRPGVSQ